MVSQNPPPRPPWFREPPKKTGFEPSGANPEGQASPDRDHPRPGFSPGGSPIILDNNDTGSAPPSTPNPAHPAQEPPQSPPAGRFPIRPNPAPPFSGEENLSEDRKASIEARMLALEHDYAQSAESWRESSLAMVRALEILENRIGSNAGQPLGGMGSGEISSELAALRAEMAQIRARIDGFLPPPPGQGFAAQMGNPLGHTPPPPPPPPHAGRSYGVPPRAPSPPRARRHVGRTLLSWFATLAGIVFAWFVATHFETLRGPAMNEGFDRLIGGKPEVSLYRPPAGDQGSLSPLGHYEKALSLYRAARHEKDISQASAHFDAAASHGMAAAQFWLGYMHEKGLGISRSFSQAAKLYGQAGSSGHIKAMHNLGVMYLEGRGVAYDAASASEWLLRASRYGFAESMNLLGFINEEGMLGARNLKHAYAWYSLAARTGHKGAQEYAPRIAASLSHGDRRAAEALVNNWRVRKSDPAVNGVIAAMKPLARPRPPARPRLHSPAKRSAEDALFSHYARPASDEQRAPHYVAPPHPNRKR